MLALLDALEAADGIEMHSLMVLRHGTVVAEGWWSPYTRERPHLLYSLEQELHLDRGRVRRRRGAARPRRHRPVALPRARRGRDRPAQPLHARAARRVDGQWARRGDLGPRGRSGAGRAGARLPDAAARERPGDGVRLQPAVHLQPRRDHPAPVGDDPDRLPATAPVRPARHRRGGLAAAPGRAGPRLHRVARHHRGRRTAGPALPAGRLVGRRPAAVRGLGRRRPPGRTCPTPEGPTPTGARATGSSSGGRGTATAGTVPTGSSAWCCPSRTPWWSRPRRRRTCRASWTRSGSTSCRPCVPPGPVPGRPPRTRRRSYGAWPGCSWRCPGWNRSRGPRATGRAPRSRRPGRRWRPSRR